MLLAVCLALTGCNVTSGSRIVVGTKRVPIAPEQVRIYVRPPAKFEEVAIVNASSKNIFATEQSLTDSALLKMKSDAAKLGANGILLSGVGDRQIGMVGSSFGQATAYSTAQATAYRTGNQVNAYGSGVTNVYGSGTSFNSAVFARVTSGMAIYVERE